MRRPYKAPPDPSMAARTAVCPSLDLFGAVFAGPLLHHRSFNVLRAIRARKIVMIQKRTITFGSAHPLSSK